MWAWSLKDANFKGQVGVIVRMLYEILSWTWENIKRCKTALTLRTIATHVQIMRLSAICVYFFSELYGVLLSGCGDHPPIENGNFTLSHVHGYYSNASYSCIQNFFINGSDWNRCNGGPWLNSFPVCQSMYNLITLHVWLNKQWYHWCYHGYFLLVTMFTLSSNCTLLYILCEN